MKIMIYNNNIKSYELVMLNKSYKIEKILYEFQYWSSEIILKEISKIFFIPVAVKIIFKLFWSQISQLGVNESKKKYKFYIGLYNSTFKEWLHIISICRKVLWIKNQYILEKDFYKFDCIWFDIVEEWVEMKIYEIVMKKHNLEWLPKYIDSKNVQEVWYLKSLGWRKKKFFRFKNSENIQLFKKEFDFSKLDSILKWMSDSIKIKRKVKYYCIEWNRKEIYFI